MSIWVVCLGPLPICLLSPCRGLRASKREKPVVFLSFFSFLDMELSCFFLVFTANMDLPWWLSGKEPICQCKRHRRHGFDPWVRKMPQRRACQPTPVFLPGKSPWTEEPNGLQSMGLQRVRQDWSNWVCVCMPACAHTRTRAHTHTHTHTHTHC